MATPRQLPGPTGSGAAAATTTAAVSGPPAQVAALSSSSSSTATAAATAVTATAEQTPSSTSVKTPSISSSSATGTAGGAAGGGGGTSAGGAFGEYDDDDDGDWAAEFDMDEPITRAPQVIGRQANPLDHVNWDEDFDFDEENKVFRSSSLASSAEKKKGGGLQRKSSKLAPALQHVRHSLLFGQEFADMEGLSADQAGESGSITSQTGAATSTDESNAITGDDESEEDWDKEFSVQPLAVDTNNAFTTLKMQLFKDDVPAAPPSTGNDVADDNAQPHLEFHVPRPNPARLNIVLYPKASQLYDLKGPDGKRTPITEIALESWLRDLFRRTPDASPSQTPPQITRSLTIVRRKVSGPRDPAHVRPLSTPDVEQLVLAAISNDNIDGNLAFQKAVDSMLKSHPSVVTTLVNDWFAACEKSVNLAIQPESPVWWNSQQLLYLCAQAELNLENANVDTPLVGLPTVAQLDTRLRKLGPGWALLFDYYAVLIEAHKKSTRGGSGPFEALSYLSQQHDKWSSMVFQQPGLATLTIDLVSCIIMILHGVSPLSMAVRTNDDDGDQSPVRETQVMLLSPLVTSGSDRLDALRQALPSMPAGYFRARVVFALASEILRELGDTHVAESLLYECLYILDHSAELRPCLMGQFGLQAALLYGDVLLTNRKYKFGILSLEGALVNLQQRNKFGEQRRSIERKLAVIAYDQKDWPRALLFYKSVYTFAKNDNKLNEVVHIALMLNTIYTELGDFAGAEETLLKAMELFAPPLFVGGTSTGQTPSSSSIKPVYWALPQRLCEIYLKFGCHDACITWLERALLSDFIPINKLSTFAFLLAEAYSGKDWIKDVFGALSLFDLGSGGVPTRIVARYSPANLSASSKLAGSSATSGNTSAINQVEYINPVVEHLSKNVLSGILLKLPSEGMYHDVIKLTVRTCLSAGRIEDALAIVNSAIKLCGESNLMSKGRLWLRKGKATVASTWLNPALAMESSADIDGASAGNRFRSKAAAAFTNTISAASGNRARSKTVVSSTPTASSSATLPSRRNLPPSAVDSFSPANGGGAASMAVPPKVRSGLLGAPRLVIPQSPMVGGGRMMEVPQSPLHIVASELLPSSSSVSVATSSAAAGSAASSIKSPSSGSISNTDDKPPIGPFAKAVVGSKLVSKLDRLQLPLPVDTRSAPTQTSDLLTANNSTLSSVPVSFTPFQRSLNSIATACFTRAVGYFVSAADRHCIAKCRCLSSAHTLDRCMQAWINWQHTALNLSPAARLQAPFELKPQAVAEIRSLTKASSEFFFATCHVKGMLQSLLSYAELELVVSAKDPKKLKLSQAYWLEAYHLFTSVFVRQNDIVLRRRASPRFLEFVLRQNKRLVRLLFCYPNQFAADHLMTFELYLSAQHALHMTLQKPVPRTRVPHDSSAIVETARKSTTGNRPLLFSLFPSAGGRRRSTITPIETLSTILSGDLRQDDDDTPISSSSQLSSSSSSSQLHQPKDSADASPPNSGKTSAGTIPPTAASQGSPLTHSTSSTAISTLAQTRDPLAEKSWTCFQLMSTNFKQFAAGTISEEKLQTANQDLLERLQALNRPYGGVPRDRRSVSKRRNSFDGLYGENPPPPGTESSSTSENAASASSDSPSGMSKYTYQQWSQRLPKEIFSGTLAVFEMDGFLAAYAPSTGFRSLKRLPLGVRSPPSTESISVMVQIQDSYALFKMPPEATLDAMSTYLMTLVPQSKNDIDDILSMPFTPTSMSDPMAPVSLPSGGVAYAESCSPNFWRLLGSTGKPESRPKEVAPNNSDRLVCFFAISQDRPEDVVDSTGYLAVRSAYLSLGHFMQRTLASLAADMTVGWDSRHVHLSIVTTTEQEDAFIRRWESPFVSPPLVEYAQNLAAIGRDSPLATKSGSVLTPALLGELQRMLVPWINDAVISLSEKNPSKLMIIASPVHQLLPWSTLIHNAFTVHPSMSLSSLIKQAELFASAAQTSAAQHQQQLANLRFVVFYYDRENEEPLEVYKERLLLDELALGLAGVSKRLVRGSETSWPWLLQSALVRKGRKISAYRKKYKRTEFIDLSAVIKNQRSRDPLAMVRDAMYDRYGDRGGPIVFLMSTADLFGMTEWLEKLLCVDGNLAFVFVPAVLLKRVAQFLNDYMDDQQLATAATEKRPFDILEQAVMAARNNLTATIILVKAPCLTIVQ